jgi:hypothetical protein
VRIKSLFLRKVFWYVYLSLLYLFTPSFSAYGNEIPAASGSRADIQAAADAAQPGDTIVIPAGTWDLSGQVFLPDGIHVKGAGRDNTILRKAYPSQEDKDPMFNVRCTATHPFRFSGITLYGDGVDRFWNGQRGSSILDTGLLLNGKCINFQIYDSRFSRFAGEGIFIRGNPLNIGPGNKIQGHPKGVVYNNEFIDNLYNNGFGYGIQLAGDENDWTLSLGSDNAVFIEDNYFDRNRHAIASNNASRYVFRYNTIVNNWYPWWAIDVHGLAAWPRGSRSYEIYGNTITGGIEWDTGNSHSTWGIGIRGGDGVIFDNSFSGVSLKEILITIEGTANRGYPLRDQTRDLWIWNNTSDGNPVTQVSLGWNDDMRTTNAEYLQEGRDYHFQQKPGYRPFTYPHPLRNTKPPQAPTNLRILPSG